MAQDVVDRLTDRPCRTRRLPLVGAAPPAALRSVAAPERLVRRYGTEAPAVAALADGRPELLELVAPGVPVCGAELLWAARHELALTLVGPRRPPGARRARAGVAGRGGRGGRARSGSTPRRHEPRACREAGSRLARGRVVTYRPVEGDNRPLGRPQRPIHQPPLPSRSSPAPSIRPMAYRELLTTRRARRLPVDPRRRPSRERTASSPTPASTSSRSTARLIVAGPATRAHLTTTGGAAFGVRFRVGAAGAALGLPAAELLDASVALEDVWGAAAAAGSRSGRRTCTSSRGGPRHDASARPTRSCAPPPPARRAARSGSATASSAAASPTPSATARRRSSGSCASSASSRSPARQADLARLALDAGYADQAHLTRECTRLAGLPPAALLAEGAGPAGERSVSFKTARGAPATMAA